MERTDLNVPPESVNRVHEKRLTLIDRVRRVLHHPFAGTYVRHHETTRWKSSYG
jgi:hypothetical protein